jgi:hypothetical protein
MALESLSLPASLTVLSEHALGAMPLLKSLTFESGSNLREIQNCAFSRCESLKSIFLPASLSTLSADTFLSSSIEEVVIDAANPRYFVSGRFLIGVDGMKLIRYFGRAEDLGIDCLRDLGLRQICQNAFSYCSALKSIFVPASIEVLGLFSFASCSSLRQVRVESGSKIPELGQGTFVGCSSLRSVDIPATVETIADVCFDSCTSLVEILFEPGSKLTRIEMRAFCECCSLRSFVVPAQLEIMGYGVFRGCTSLCELIFEVPSRLKQLDLPPSEFGSLFIPDCVEVVFSNIGRRDGQRRLLQFGRESSLKRIELINLEDFWDEDVSTEGNSFMDLSEEVLRRFRCQFEDL